MSVLNMAGVDFQYGLNCIVTSVKSEKEVNLRFVIEKKQYTVTYLERKKRFDDRNLSLLLKGSEAVKASIWNVPFGPPGSNKRSWYITDIWTPNIVGMEKKRIPEPTISVVCKITYNLGKEFVVCEVGKYFTRDVIVLPRAFIRPGETSSGNAEPEIGDYLLVFVLVIWERQDDEQKARLIPLWAHWDKCYRTQSCTAHLNIVESGPEHSTLLIPDQIPCMWGVIQNVFKKSLKAYVPSICSSISIPLSAIYQYNNTYNILDGDWLQLWLTPQVKGQTTNHISEVNNWLCSSCCWFGSRAKKRYETYLQHRLSSRYFRHSLLNSADVNTKPTNTSTKRQINPKVEDKQNLKLAPDVIGIGKVKIIKDKSGTLLISTKEYVFHLGIMTIFGVKMSKLKTAKLKDLVDVGSELKYKLSPYSDSLRAVWIGPEVVTFKHLNFMPQLTAWMKKMRLEAVLVKEMMKEVMENYEASSKTKEKESPIIATNQTFHPKKEIMTDNEGNSSQIGSLQFSSNSNQTYPNDKEELSIVNDISSGIKEPTVVENLDASYCPEDMSSCLTYSKEEEEELEKLWWSEDSEESEDELRPILRPTMVSPVAEKDIAVGPQTSSSDIIAASTSQIDVSKSDSETEDSSSLSVTQFIGGNLSEDSSTISHQPSGSSASISQMPAIVIPKPVETSNLIQDSPEASVFNKQLPEKIEHLSKSKSKDVKSVPTLLVMMELTKFLLEKGKAHSIPEAGEVSAEFVAQLECAMSKTINSGIAADSITDSVATQTIISGPIVSLFSDFNNSENFSSSC